MSASSTDAPVVQSSNAMGPPNRGAGGGREEEGEEDEGQEEKDEDEGVEAQQEQ